jgi:hypothetical protein
MSPTPGEDPEPKLPPPDPDLNIPAPAPLPNPDEPGPDVFPQIDPDSLGLRSEFRGHTGGRIKRLGRHW